MDGTVQQARDHSVGILRRLVAGAIAAGTLVERRQRDRVVIDGENTKAIVRLFVAPRNAPDACERTCVLRANMWAVAEAQRAPVRRSATTSSSSRSSSAILSHPSQIPRQQKERNSRRLDSFPRTKDSKDGWRLTFDTLVSAIWERTPRLHRPRPCAMERKVSRNCSLQLNETSPRWLQDELFIRKTASTENLKARVACT
jgi:hypothetical protein